MPVYVYRCESCDHKFEEILNLSERETPTKEPCPKCKTGKVDQVFGGGTAIVDAVRMNPGKRLDPRFKERMRQIKKLNPGSTIKDY